MGRIAQDIKMNRSSGVMATVGRRGYTGYRNSVGKGKRIADKARTTATADRFLGKKLITKTIKQFNAKANPKIFHAVK